MAELAKVSGNETFDSTDVHFILRWESDRSRETVFGNRELASFRKTYFYRVTSRGGANGTEVTKNGVFGIWCFD